MKTRPKELEKININEQLGSDISQSLVFINEEGKYVSLGSFFDGEIPVVLILAYYKCPMLCGLVMNGLADVTDEVDLKMGEDYRVVTISINPKEDFELASVKREKYATYVANKNNVYRGWSFLVGSQENISTLARLIGFEYYYDEKKKEYAHPAVLTLLSPDGNITRYLYGIEFDPKSFKLSILESGQGKVGTIIDRIILSCYSYDPASNSYAPVARNIMKIGGGITVLVGASFFMGMWVRMKRKTKPDKIVKTYE